MRIALIRNPLSRLNARGARPDLPVPTAEPYGEEDLRRVLSGFRADHVTMVAVDGGDGTVREVLTALVGMNWFPRLAILPAGKINLIARDVGFPHHHVHLPTEGLRVHRRPLLRLDHGGGTSYGMFLGAAGFRLAWEMANRHLHPRGLSSAAAVIAALALTLGRTDSASEAMKIRLDEGEATEGRRFLMLATTLNSLMLGLWPFWGEGEGLRILDIAAPPRRLMAALPALARGHPAPWMEQAGYRSHRAKRVELCPTYPVILDGEPFAPGPDGKLVLSLGPEMEFMGP